MTPADPNLTSPPTPPPVSPTEQLRHGHTTPGHYSERLAAQAARPLAEPKADWLAHRFADADAVPRLVKLPAQLPPGELHRAVYLLALVLRWKLDQQGCDDPITLATSRIGAWLGCKPLTIGKVIRDLIRARLLEPATRPVKPRGNRPGKAASYWVLDPRD